MLFESDIDHLIIHYSSSDDLASKIMLASVDVSKKVGTPNLSKNYMLNSVREISELLNKSCLN